MTDIYVHKARYINRKTKVLKTVLNGRIHKKRIRLKTCFLLHKMTCKINKGELFQSCNIIEPQGNAHTVIFFCISKINFQYL